MGILIFIVAFILAILMTRKTKGIVTRLFAVIFYTVLFFLMLGFILILSGNL